MKIVVLENSFVYLASGLKVTQRTLVLTGARAIRQWGTARGLGQLALSGPTNSTVLDDPIDVIVVARARHHHTLSVTEAARAAFVQRTS
jgi:hypothetical protein